MQKIPLRDLPVNSRDFLSLKQSPSKGPDRLSSLRPSSCAAVARRRGLRVSMRRAQRLQACRNHGRPTAQAAATQVKGRFHTGPATLERNPAMANILVNIEKGIEIGAEDALKWLIGANKTLQAAPAVVAALATLIGAVEKPLSELAGAAANPLNIPLDVQTVSDLKAVWPDVKTFLATLGVKF